MSKAPTDWMPLNVGEYLADTMDLSAEQHGAYFMLIMHYWKNRGPIKDDKTLQNVSKISWKNTQEILQRFFKLSDGLWCHKRIDEELSTALEMQQKKKNQTAAATAARAAKTSDVTNNVTSTPLPLPSSEDKSSSESMSRDFEEFWTGWKPFEMPKGSRQEAEQRYRQARKRASHATIIAARDGYLAECHRLRSKTKHACVWLNKGGFAESYDAPAGAIESNGELIRTIDREEYERAKRLIATAPNRKGFQSVIDAYERQNPQTGTPVAPLHRHAVTSTPDARG